MVKTKLKRTVFITAIISLLSFAYKLTLGILNMSLILMIAATSTLLVFSSKVLFLKNYTKTREQKKKAYLVIAIITLIYSVIFVLFSVLKVYGIDASNQKTYEGWFGSLFIAFILVMFILSLLGLKGALEKTDIIVVGLKEIIFVSALTDLVIIEEFISRIILEYQDVANMALINSYFTLGVAALMLIIPTIMIIRGVRYKA